MQAIHHDGMRLKPSRSQGIVHFLTEFLGSRRHEDQLRAGVLPAAQRCDISFDGPVGVNPEGWRLWFSNIVDLSHAM